MGIDGAIRFIRLRYQSSIGVRRYVHRPSQLKICVRLTLCFVTIVLLMVVSHLFTLWQFDRVRRQEERIHHFDLESRAVLSVHASLLVVQNKLEDAATTKDPDRFVKEAAALRRQFLEDVDRATLTLNNSQIQVEQDSTMVSSLETIRSALPEQIDALRDLAIAGDWTAVDLRLRNEFGPLSSLTSSLVEKIDLAVAAEQAQAQENIQHLQRRVFGMHALAIVITLLVAAFLGAMVTRSITEPLAQLDAGAQALARGDFEYRVAVEGRDELSTLGRVFNDATQRLSDLYGALKTSEERFRTVVAAAPVGIAVLDHNSIIHIFNQKFLEIVGLTGEQALGLRLSDPSIAVFHEDGTPCPTAERPTQKAITTGKPVLNVVVRHVHPVSGEQRWILTSAWPLLYADGSVYQVISALTDITKQKNAEHTLLQMSERLLRIQEEEQRRIAREVHDSTSQEMTALTLTLGALKASEPPLPEETRMQIAESLVLAKRVAREIRTFSYLLHPPMLNELGLWAALRMFVEEFRERSGLQVSLEISKEAEAVKLHVDQEIALFRFVQEALANVHRHSGSETAAIDVKQRNRSIEASVTDTGRGFPPGLLNEIRATSGLAGGVGIPGMHERISYVGGRVEIRSNEHGATIAAVVPEDYRGASSDTQDTTWLNRKSATAGTTRRSN